MPMTPQMMADVHQALDNTSTLAAEQIFALYEMVYGADRAEFERVVGEIAPEILASFRSTSVDIMAGALDEGTSLALSADAMASSAYLNPNRVTGLTGWVAAEMADPESALRKLAGIGVKLVLEGPRRYSTAVAEENDTTARTFAQPGACEWCRYIAVQGHRYGAYGGEWVQQFHEHCRCVLIPAAEYIEPDYVLAWDRQFDQAGDMVGSAYGKRTWRQYMAKMRELNKQI